MVLAADPDASDGESFVGRLHAVIGHSLLNENCEACGVALDTSAVTVSQRAKVLFMVDLHCAACGHTREGWVVRNEAVDAVIASVYGRAERKDPEESELTDAAVELMRFKEEWDRVEQLSELWS